MLKFFRKIRLKLIDKGTLIARPAGLKKYLIYAIGEILLVVIGILIALQINNANEHRKLRSSEKIYLKEIRNDLIQDTLLLTEVINDAKYRIAQLINQDTTINYRFNKIIGALPEAIEKEQIEYFFRTDREFRVKSGTYNSMISEGKSSLISNRQLFNNLQNIYEVEVKSLDEIGQGVWDRSIELSNKYAYEIKYGEFGNPIKISDKYILADLNNSFRLLNFYTRQSSLLKQNIIELIRLIEIEYKTS